MRPKKGKMIPCGQCGTEVYRNIGQMKAHKQTFCSHRCYSLSLKGVRTSPKTEFKPGNKPWNTGVSVRLSPATEFKKGQVSLNKGKKASLESRKKMSDSHIGIQAKEKHPRWKEAGDYSKDETPLYKSLHGWIQNHKGKSNRCEWCGSEGKTHMANLDYEYTRDLDTWAELCPKCHVNYDMQNGWGAALEKFEIVNRPDRDKPYSYEAKLKEEEVKG